MSRGRMLRGALVLAIAVLIVALVLSEAVRDFAAATALLTWLVICGLIGLGIWATRQLPKPTRRGKSPPGAQWFPTGTWWGHRRRDDQ